jgi:hypothetical protein
MFAADALTNGKVTTKLYKHSIDSMLLNFVSVSGNCLSDLDFINNRASSSRVLTNDFV